MSKATLRKLLTEIGFDWSTGRIIVPNAKEPWPRGYDAGPRRLLPHNDEGILDHEFCDGYGLPELPTFIAEDTQRIYVPAHYDGSTWVEAIEKDIDTYLNTSTEMPYIGVS